MKTTCHFKTDFYNGPNPVSLTFYPQHDDSGVVLYIDEERGAEVITVLSLEQIEELNGFLQQHLEQHCEPEFGWLPR